MADHHHQQHIRSFSGASFSHSIRSDSSSPAPFASSAHAPSSSAIPYPHHRIPSQHHEHSPPVFLPSSRPSTAASIRTAPSTYNETPRHHDFCTMCIEDHVTCDRHHPACSRCVALRFECKYSQRARRAYRNQHTLQRSRGSMTNITHARDTLSASPSPSVRPGPTEVEQLAGIANDLNHLLDRAHEMQGGAPHAISSTVGAQVAKVTELLEHTATSVPHNTLQVSWRGVVKTVQEASDKEAMRPQTVDETVLLYPYTCSPEAEASWGALERKCSTSDSCDTKIQRVMKRLYSMHSLAIFEVDENDKKATDGKRTKLWSLEEMQAAMVCTCSQKARTACLIIMCCFSLLHVYEVNMLAISRRQQSQPGSPPPSASPSVSAPPVLHRRAIPFSTIILPPLPKGESRVKDIASYSAANQQIEMHPDLTMPMSSTPQQLRLSKSPPAASPTPGPVGSSPRSSPLGSPPPPPVSLGYRPSRDFLLHQTAPAVGKVAPQKTEADLLVISGFHHSMRFINEVATRYQSGAHIEASDQRTGTDRTDELSAPRGMALKLREKLVQVLEMLSSIHMQS